MMIIAGLAFYVGTLFSKPATSVWNTPTNVVSSEDVTIRVIDDTRCSNCETDAIVGQLESLAFLSEATIVRQDFSDAGVAEYMTENNLTNIPSIIFNTNTLNDGGQIVPYLITLWDGNFSLTLPETFNPFEERSEKGFLTMDLADLEAIKASSITDGNVDAPITVLEYSDLECPFCAKFHNDGTPKALQEKYGDNMNIIFNHFPLDFHANALPAAQALECVREQGGDFYGLIDASFEKYSNNNFSLPGFYELAAEYGADSSLVQECVKADTYSEAVLAQMTTGQTLFGVTGTPGNVVINNATWEYEVVSGAYPASTFEAIIDRMLAE